MYRLYRKMTNIFWSIFKACFTLNSAIMNNVTKGLLCKWRKGMGALDPELSTDAQEKD